jgi:hypothetical protein
MPTKSQFFCSYTPVSSALSNITAFSNHKGGLGLISSQTISRIIARHNLSLADVHKLVNLVNLFMRTNQRGLLKFTIVLLELSRHQTGFLQVFERSNYCKAIVRSCIVRSAYDALCEGPVSRGRTGAYLSHAFYSSF